ncbi:MAG: hypothetical protein R3B46_00350 [Phycisphaerales bacterium]|nr:hypothetical protein [Phycisphaerales bacterium]
MGERQSNNPPTVHLPEGLDTALKGTLPCIVCGYDLKGLSVRGVCPECGTAVRAAILYQVDPEAEEFTPVRAPRATGLALVLWPAGALIVIAAGWAMRIADLTESGALSEFALGWGGVLTTVGLALSALGAIGLINPTRATRKWGVIAATIGTLCYIPIYIALHRVLLIDTRIIPYIEAGAVYERSLYRLVTDIALVGLLLGLRPNARELVRRSLALRTGRVDRQTLLAMVGAVLVAIAGDTMHIIAATTEDAMGELLFIAGTVLIAIASVFLTMGAISALIDGSRIRRAVIHPPKTIKELLGHEP